MPTSAKHQNDFLENVFEVVRQIPHGRVTSYGAIAKYLGTAKSSRMVGWVLHQAGSQTGYVPAHRVVNRQGLLTGKIHFASPTMMQELLENEGVEIEEDKVIRFKELFWNPEELDRLI